MDKQEKLREHNLSVDEIRALYNQLIAEAERVEEEAGLPVFSVELGYIKGKGLKGKFGWGFYSQREKEDNYIKVELRDEETLEFKGFEEVLGELAEKL